MTAAFGAVNSQFAEIAWRIDYEKIFGFYAQQLPPNCFVYILCNTDRAASVCADKRGRLLSFNGSERQP